jgi:catechol 2,3-dioxygenase-like lactoylglutathione lyase family enzyme
MIDHIGISVGSIARATEFYLKALAPLGYGIVMEVSAEETGHGAAIAFGAPGEAADFQSGKPSFWVGESAEASGPLHVAFVAPSRAAVDVFYHAAVEAGGADNGAPGLRPHYHATITPPSCSIPTATISKPYATALNESRRARPPGGELMNCLLRPATAGRLGLKAIAMSAIGTSRTSHLH